MNYKSVFLVFLSFVAVSAGAIGQTSRMVLIEDFGFRPPGDPVYELSLIHI